MRNRVYRYILPVITFLLIATAAQADNVQTATNTAALSAISVSGGPPAVMRLGYAAAGDAPPLLYIASSSPCSMNSGSGDGGAQAPSADGKCWVATFPAEGADIREWGRKPTDLPLLHPHSTPRLLPEISVSSYRPRQTDFMWML